ncbi:MAG: ribonuclease III [Candidatus Symbiothrix sp.]|nr:ribonuclease III [Candidatus Symbiothrix sp.]
MLINLLNRIRLLFHPKKESYFAIYKITGVFPHNVNLYEEALLHKSYFIENPKGHYCNNERLEFLGDAVLDAVIADILFKKFKRRNEGFLTNTRSKIVKRETLDMVSRELGLHKLLVASSYTKLQKNHILGNALEAFIGAIYLDLGYLKTYRFIEEKIIKACINIDAIAKKEVNFKSKLLEWSQKYKVELEFNLVEKYKDNDNNPIFQSQALLNGKLGGIGTGYSKKESQQEASQMALKKIKSDKAFLQDVLLYES